VDVWLSVEGVDPVAGLEELSEWLAHEPHLRGLLSPRIRPPQTGELGVLADALVAAIGSGGALTVLVGSLKTYLSQPRHADVRIVVSSPDGRRVEIDVKRARDAEALVRNVLELPE
jgi:hypothetical protein